MSVILLLSPSASGMQQVYQRHCCVLACITSSVSASQRKAAKRDFLAHLDSHDLPFLQLVFFFLFKGMTHHFDPQ